MRDVVALDVRGGRREVQAASMASTEIDLHDGAIRRVKQVRPVSSGADPQSKERTMTSTESEQRAEDQGGVVVPLRRPTAGDEQWEPWVGERAVAMHYDVSTRTVRRWRAGGMP